ncbi:MAG: linear amide C-N hydrolase [Clostridiales bacterium]|nr:linear amide C-N hydrolase [Clostridiales bacterium]
MKTKRNKKAIIITAIIMLVGILLVLAGFFGGWFVGLFYEDLDYQNISDEDLGKPVETDIFVYYDDIDLENKTLQLVGDMNEEYKFILLDFSQVSDEVEKSYYSKNLQNITISGTLRAVDDAEYREVAESLFRLYDYLYEEGDLKERITIDEFHQLLLDSVIPYCIDVKTVDSFYWLPFIPIGIVIVIVTLLLEICFIFKLKKRIVLPVVLGILIIVPFIMFFDHIRTILTINKVTDGFYTMKNLECTDTQGMLDSGSDSVDELILWISDNHLYGMAGLLGENKVGFGCAAFAAVTPEGDHLFGRNFDLFETDTLLIYSHPDGAYESIGIADLGVFGVGQTASISPDSSLGKLIMVVTPYAIVDGMNEKGVGAGILQLNIEETHQDNGKPDLLIFCAIRGILDTCASVDEALLLLDSYDIQSGLDADYQLFITDKSGKYVVVCWLGGEMTVVEYPCCTNSVIAPGEYYDMGSPDDRLGTIEICLGSDMVVTEEEAMEILDIVHNKDLTEWSCVYNLDDFTVSICLDSDYENVYTFSAGDLK